jgi:hypothetical protein
LEGSKTSGIMRRRGRVNKLADEWGKEEIFLGRGDKLGLESIVIMGLLYEHCCPRLVGWCPL